MQLENKVQPDSKKNRFFPEIPNTMHTCIPTMRSKLILLSNDESNLEDDTETLSQSPGL